MQEINHDVNIYEQFEVHSAAGLFPAMRDDEFAQLKADIREHGQKMPILVYHNKIVDGRQRLRACRELGIEPVFVAIEDLGMPVQSFVVSQNLHRRHLDDSQRAMIAARLTKTKVGANQHTAQAVSQKQAAADLKVSVDSLQRASKVIQSGHEGLIEAVDSGKIDVSNAGALVILPQKELDELVKKEAKDLLEQAKQVRADERERVRQVKLAQLDHIRAGNKPFDHSVGPFNVVYADPPWDYLSELSVGYPTMKLDEICNLLRDSKAVAYDAVLFLWVPASLMAEGLKVIEAWGFKYRTQAIWHKGGSGMGPYFRVNHEVLMLATRGNTMPEVPAKSRFTSVFQYDRRAHSQKPDEFYEVIEKMYPELPKMELFRRGVPRDGWYCWGNEVQDRPIAQLEQQIIDAMQVEQVADDMEHVSEMGNASNDTMLEAA